MTGQYDFPRKRKRATNVDEHLQLRILPLQLDGLHRRILATAVAVLLGCAGMEVSSRPDHRFANDVGADAQIRLASAIEDGCWMEADC